MPFGAFFIVLDSCFFNVELPAYSSEEKLRERLTTVIDLDWGMSGDDDSMQSVDMRSMLGASIPAPSASPPASSSAAAAASSASAINAAASSSSSSSPTRTSALAAALLASQLGSSLPDLVSDDDDDAVPSGGLD